MKYYTETSIAEFKAWAGAAQRLEELKEHPEALEYIGAMLDELSSCCELTETDINDYIWFQMEDDLAEEGYIDPETGDYIERNEHRAA